MQFPLVAEAEYPYQGPFRNEVVERRVASAAKRDQKLANFAGDVAPHQRMLSQDVNPRHYRLFRRSCSRRIFLEQELHEPFELIERLGRVDYLRHGLGRGDFCP